MDLKEKNKEVSELQQARQEKQEAKAEKPSATEKLTEQIAGKSASELRGMLSKRNEDYIFRLEKFLQESGLSKGDAELKANDLLEEVVVAQRKGQPATQLYGSPQIKANDILNPQAKPSDVKFWQKVVDNSLLYLAIFCGMFGAVGLFSKAEQPTGVITLLSVGILFGALMTYYNDLLLRKKEDRPATWKLFLGGVIIITIIFMWITVTQLPALRIINPVLPAWLTLIFAAAAFLGRRFFREKYNITTSAFAGPNQPNAKN